MEEEEELVAMLLSFLYLNLLSAVIAIIIFGSGQVFLPVFQWIWNLFEGAFPNLTEENFNLVITVTNSTPGIFSEKLSFFSGLLTTNSLPLGILNGTIVFLAFTWPAMAIMELGWLYLRRIPNYKKIIRNLLPVIAGILLSITLQIFMKTFVPWFKFNSTGSYFSWIDSAGSAISYLNLVFFSGYRSYLLVGWVLVSLPLSYYLTQRKNISGIKVILTYVILCFIIFQPWL